jgi:hypothetical protein
MHRAPRLVLIAVLLAGVVAPVRGQEVAVPRATPLSDAAIEEFLLKARVVKKKTSKKGVTATTQATLSDGRLTHDAQIQTVDIAQTVFEAGRNTELNFKDTYRFNIGAYRLARLLDMDNVPMSVKRRHDGKDAAFTWWLDDVMFDEEGRLKQKPVQGPDPDRTSKQIANRLVFDELIQNRDRNQGNLLWTRDWKLWLIDHTRAFRLGKDLVKPEQLSRIDSALLDKLRGLTLDAMTRSMGDVMQRDELAAVLIRRDKLVKHFEDRIATRGEAVVLFKM